MDTLKAIFSRRSFRKYSGKEVSDADLDTILKAAMYAPSARNKQPWHFVVIRKREILDSLGTAHPYGKMLTEVNAAILVCGDLNLEESESYLLQDCSAATQNILLAAHELGLGSVWMGIQPRMDRISAVRALIRLPGHIYPVSLIAIGYPDEEKEQPERYLAERVKRDTW
jgi:nitroreductase